MNGIVIFTVLFLGIVIGALFSAPIHKMAYNVSAYANGPDEEYIDDEYRQSGYRQPFYRD